MAAETWYGSGKTPHPEPMTPMGWVRAVLRGIPLILLVLGGLLLTLVLRVIEAPVFGARRPWTPVITVAVCRCGLALLGIRYVTRGRVMAGSGAVVANHSSWLDIFALNAAQRIYFVSKSEVAGWPGIGWLARATGTLFIKRDRKEAGAQVGVFRDRLAAGHKLLFFPEGTSTDGQQVLAFKSTLFAAFFDDALKDQIAVQPVTVRYTAPKGTDPRFYGWWGDMDLGPHLLATLAAKKPGEVRVVFHQPVRVRDYANRKALAAALEAKVRMGLGCDGAAEGGEGL